MASNENGCEPKVFKLKNPYLGSTSHLYHIGLLTTDNLKERFGDVKYVCMGGKSSRMREFALHMFNKLGCPQNTEFEKDGKQIKDIAAEAGRYSMFKVGPLISVSHGIGMASLSVIMNEVFKLLTYAEASDIKMFRIGTSGGLGVEEGTIVITNQTYSSTLDPYYLHVCCGQKYKRPSHTNKQLSDELLECGLKANLKVEVGNTIGTSDFFEGQARLDGAFCDYTKEDKFAFLKKAFEEYGVKNFEMESTCFAAMCLRAELKCAIACVSVVNRLEHDDVTDDVSLLHSWQTNLYKLMAEYITRDVTKA